MKHNLSLNEEEYQLFMRVKNKEEMKETMRIVYIGLGMIMGMAFIVIMRILFS